MADAIIWDALAMLELKAGPFVHAMMQIEKIRTFASEGLAGTRSDDLVEAGERRPVNHLDMLISAAHPLGARMTLVAAERLKVELLSGSVSWRDLARKVSEIGERLTDELESAKLFVLDGRLSHLMASDHDPLPPGASVLFPSAVFEMGEAGKCLALQRSTASAFHSIRALEIAVKALARFLSIPDPVKGTDRNWGKMLEKVKSAMDAAYPSNNRPAGSEGAKVADLYATLDAVKGPWRNATMHVERTYQPDEAEHIFGCVGVVFRNLAAICDENGQPSTPGGA